MFSAKRFLLTFMLMRLRTKCGCEEIYTRFSRLRNQRGYFFNIRKKELARAIIIKTL